MKIFQLKSNKVIELSEINQQGKPFDYEKTIQQLIENNLSEIFTGLEFVKTEHQIGNQRPDTIAFDVDRNSFVIIEYKNVRHKGGLEQGLAYYNLLQEKKENFVLLYHEIKGKLLDIKKINWDDTRLIFISPEFTTNQIKAISPLLNLPIELYEIKRYDDGIITFTRIDNRATPLAASTSKRKTKVRSTFTITEYNEEDYLAGKYGTQIPTTQTRYLYERLKAEILRNFDKLEQKQKKKYVGFYSKEDGSAVCTIEVRKHKIMLTYSTIKKGIVPLSDFVRDVSKIGHWGVGHFQSEIKNEDDIKKSLPLIQKVYEFKVKSDTGVFDINALDESFSR